MYILYIYRLSDLHVYIYIEYYRHTLIIHIHAYVIAHCKNLTKALYNHLDTCKCIYIYIPIPKGLHTHIPHLCTQINTSDINIHL